MKGDKTMSIHSIVSNTVNYMNFIELSEQNITEYQPKTLLRGLYGSSMYELLEYIAIKENDQVALEKYTHLIMETVEPYLRSLLTNNEDWPVSLKDVDVRIRWDDKHYEPSFRYYLKNSLPQDDEIPKDEDKNEINSNPPSGAFKNDDEVLLGIFDLATFTFYKATSDAIIERQLSIKANLDKIKELRKERQQIINDYSYENKEGVERVISYALRKNNAEQARLETDEIDKKIQRIKEANSRIEKNLNKAISAENTRIKITNAVCDVLQRQLGVNINEYKETNYDE